MTLLETNADILRGFEVQGRSLAAPRRVDFFHLFPDATSATTFAELVGKLGFSIDVRKRDDDCADEALPWDVEASSEMVPNADTITQVEMRLDGLARSLGGRADGWGFWNEQS